MLKICCFLLLSITISAIGGENLWPAPPLTLKAKESKLPPRATVEPRQRYTLEFKAKSAGANTVENSPVLDEMIRTRFPKTTPLQVAEALLIINNKDNKNCLPTYVERQIQIYSSEWQTYKLEFYTPDTAEFLNIRFNSVDGLEVKDIDLQKVDNAGFLNVNPDLKMNKYYFPGYGNLHKTIIQEDGSLDISGGWTVCDPIAVEPEDRLKLTVDGEAPGMRLLIRTNFYRDPPEEKNFISRNKTAIAISGPRKNLEYVVVAPEESRWLRLSFSTGIVHAVKVEKVKE